MLGESVGEGPAGEMAGTEEGSVSEISQWLGQLMDF